MEPLLKYRHHDASQRQRWGDRLSEPTKCEESHPWQMREATDFNVVFYLLEKIELPKGPGQRKIAVNRVALFC